MTNPQTSTPSTSAPTAPHDPRAEPEITAAAQRVAADIDGVLEADLLPINRDVDTVATTVLGANRLIAALLPELEKMPGLDMDRVRKLGDYADALLYWSASATYAKLPPPELPGMIERGIELRERTLHDLGALVRHGLLPGSLLDGFGSEVAYRKIAHDLIGLANLVHERWPTIGGKTLITLEAMDAASTLGKEIMQAVGDRDFAEAEHARDIVRRNKAYTLVVRTYGEVRDAVLFLRRAKGDAEKITPSLFRLGTRSARDEDETKKVGSAAPASSGALGPQTSSLIVPDDATTP